MEIRVIEVENTLLEIENRLGELKNYDYRLKFYSFLVVCHFRRCFAYLTLKPSYLRMKISWVS